MSRSRLARWGACLGVVAGLGAPWPSFAEEPVRIGASIPMTGQYAKSGAYVREGYTLCQKHVNEQGGLLGRTIDVVLVDDRSEWEPSVRLYEKLILVDRVDALMGPFSALATDAVANVTEKYRKIMVAPLAATTAIWERGRKYVFMVRSPSEVYLEGFIDLAARNGLKTVALIHEDTGFPRLVVKGTTGLVTRKGMEVVLDEAYPKGSKDFSAILTKVKAAKPDVLAVAGFFWDLIAIVDQMKALDLNVQMLGSTVSTDRTVGKNGQYVYAASQWDANLAYPGVREFADGYRKEFHHEPEEVGAAAYAGCQIFAEAVRRAGSVDSEKVREQLLALRIQTVFGDYAVDERGFQIGHKVITHQFQNHKPVPLWPEGVAAGKPLFPTPPWSQR